MVAGHTHCTNTSVHLLQERTALIQCHQLIMTYPWRVDEFQNPWAGLTLCELGLLQYLWRAGCCSEFLLLGQCFQAGVSLVWQLLNSPSLRWPGGNTDTATSHYVSFCCWHKYFHPAPAPCLGWLQLVVGGRELVLWACGSRCLPLKYTHSSWTDPPQTSLPNNPGRAVPPPQKVFFSQDFLKGNFLLKWKQNMQVCQLGDDGVNQLVKIRTQFYTSFHS